MSYSVVHLKMLLDVPDVMERRQRFFDGIVNALVKYKDNKKALDVDKYVNNLSNFFPEWALRFNYVKHVKYMLTLWKDGKSVDEVQDIMNKIQQITNGITWR